MEYGLRHEPKNYKQQVMSVLILVVMEYGLRLVHQGQEPEWGLNPCCNGIWSQTINNADLLHRPQVLILVVMEYGLRPKQYVRSRKYCLNPCCNGIWSQTV